MNYVRSISGSVSKTWNSINPATLSGAIDVIVVQHDDGEILRDCYWNIVELRPQRHSDLLSISCPLREVVSTPTLRKEGIYLRLQPTTPLTLLMIG